MGQQLNLELHLPLYIFLKPPRCGTNNFINNILMYNNTNAHPYGECLKTSNEPFKNGGLNG